MLGRKMVITYLRIRLIRNEIKGHPCTDSVFPFIHLSIQFFILTQIYLGQYKPYDVSMVGNGVAKK